MTPEKAPGGDTPATLSGQSGHPESRIDAEIDTYHFLGVLDLVADGLLLFDTDGKLIHRNRSADRILDGSEGERLQQEVDHFRRVLCEQAGISPVGQVQIKEVVREGSHPAGRCRLRGGYVGPDLFGRGGSTLVIVLEARALERMPEEICRCFGLTQRESRIALMLAEGKSNAQIARELFISPNTARTHTERVLRKLGARSRAEVARILGG